MGKAAPPTFPIEKKGALKMMGESPEGGGGVNTAPPHPNHFSVNKIF